MKCVVGIFSVLYLVSNNILDVISMDLNKSLHRLKREDILIDEGGIFACQPKPEPKPDFAAAGKRISEQKCDEYKWNVKSREHQSEIKLTTNECPEGYEVFLSRDDADAAPGEDPNLVALGWKDKEAWKFKCGGSLISDKYVLTAALCVNDKVSKPEIVRFGDKNVFDKLVNGLNPIEAKIKRAIVHPEYRGENSYNDIALVELEEAVTFNKNVLPACLYNNVDISPLGKFANATGWGLVNSAKVKEDAPKPKKASLEIIDSAKCEEVITSIRGEPFHLEIKDTQICAADFVNAIIKLKQWELNNLCQGFSGDPLQMRISDSPEGAMNYVIGISSYYSTLCSGEIPDIYTRVSSYLDWIESIVWPQN